MAPVLDTQALLSLDSKSPALPCWPAHPMLQASLLLRVGKRGGRQPKNRRKIASPGVDPSSHEESTGHRRELQEGFPEVETCRAEAHGVTADH